MFVFNYANAQVEGAIWPFFFLRTLMGWKCLTNKRKIRAKVRQVAIFVLYVSKDFKKEISRFVENGFPIFRFICWPDVAWRCKQVKWGRRFPNKWQQLVSTVRKSLSAISTIRKLRSPENDFCKILLWYLWQTHTVRNESGS